MGQALNEFIARTDNLRKDILFVSSAAVYRPQVHKCLNYDGDVEAKALATSFAAVAGSVPSDIYGPLFVRLCAGFERYLRAVMAEGVLAWNTKVSSCNRLPEYLRSRNIALTGGLLAASEAPRDYQKIDVPRLIRNLSSCNESSQGYLLNGDAFSTLITGITSDVIDGGMKALHLSECWDEICADNSVKQCLESQRTSDATKEVKKKLKELSRRRNNWAHGGDDEVSFTSIELLSECTFLFAFVNSLDRAIFAQIASANL